MSTIDEKEDTTVDNMYLKRHSQKIKVLDSGTPDDINWLNMSESPSRVSLR